MTKEEVFIKVSEEAMSIRNYNPSLTKNFLLLKNTVY